MTPIDSAALVAAAFALLVAVMTVVNIRYFEVLAERRPPAPDEYPRLSIIVPARDEETNVEAAVRRMCEADYPDLEVIAVDDRSTDATAAILDRLDEEYDVLTVRHLDVLPEGWLGKVNALEQGRRAATGDVILLMDGDVLLGPSLLKTATATLLTEELDHISLVPVMRSASPPSQIFVNSAMHSLMSFVPGRHVCDPDSPAGIGSGGFNMATRDALEGVGGFEPLRLEVIDDGAFGHLLAKHGYRSRAFSGRGGINVDWYSDTLDFIKGLEKNSFAMVQFNPLATAGLLVFFMVVWCSLFVAPWFATSWWITTTALVALGAYGAALMVESRRLGLPLWADIFYPIGSLMLPIAMAHSAARCLFRGAVVWRGTRYPLAQLRNGQKVALHELQLIKFGLLKPSLAADHSQGR